MRSLATIVVIVASPLAASAAEPLTSQERRWAECSWRAAKRDEMTSYQLAVVQGQPSASVYEVWEDWDLTVVLNECGDLPVFWERPRRRYEILLATAP